MDPDEPKITVVDGLTFEQLNVSTSTVQAGFDGEDLSPSNIFYLMPTTHVISNQRLTTSQITIQHHQVLVGAVICLTYGGYRRGILKKKPVTALKVDGTPKKNVRKQPKPVHEIGSRTNENLFAPSEDFKNVVEVYIASPTKYLSVKICRSKERDGSKMIITGVKEISDCFEAVQLMTDALKRLQRTLDRLREHSTMTQEIVAWLKWHCQSNQVIRRPLLDGTVEMEFYTWIDPSTVIPDHFDPFILGYCLALIKDCKYYSLYCKMLDSLLRVTSIVDLNMRHRYLVEQTVNYPFNLGFEVDRNKFIRYFSTHSTDFVFNYLGNTNYLKLELPYKYNLPVPRTKKEIPSYSFNIFHRKGSVMQTGLGDAFHPNGQKMIDQNCRRDAFIKFVTLMRAIRSEIELTDRSAVMAVHQELVVVLEE